MPPVRPLTDTLRTSARLGTPVAPALTRLAADVRADLRRRAEARARTVPVRLCFPLVGCILPAFALLTVVPVVLDGLHADAPAFPFPQADRARVAPDESGGGCVDSSYCACGSPLCARSDRSEAGQSTAEYALVMIAAAAVAGLLLMWAHKTNLVSGLFDAVIKKVLPF